MTMNERLTAIETLFIRSLNYWIKRKTYGVEHEGQIWIYNTLEDWASQLETSKRSIQRAIKSLKEKNYIKSAFLDPNRRNRTLFYTINYDKFKTNILNKRSRKKTATLVVKTDKKLNSSDHMNGHMVGHMYNISNSNNINKSYKSDDILKLKNTTVQDMLKALNLEFPDIQVFLNKSISRSLVAAFKWKFKNSLNKWLEFLKLVKTSSYLMSEKFHLTLQWLLKFSTIDRLLQGDLGVKLKEVFFSQTKDEELETQKKIQKKTSELKLQIENLDETEVCKKTRKRILQKIGNTKYETWFKRVFFKEKNNGIVISVASKTSLFVYDYITNHFRDILDSLNLMCHAEMDLI